MFVGGDSADSADSADGPILLAGHPLRSSTFTTFFNLLEKAKVSAGAGFKRFLAELGSSPISHPK